MAVQSRRLDAFVLTAERGSFLTLLHPEFSVAVPHPLEIRLPLGKDAEAKQPRWSILRNVLGWQRIEWPIGRREGRGSASP